MNSANPHSPPQPQAQSQSTVQADDPVLDVQKLVKSYGGARVVDEVFFTVERGEIFGLRKSVPASRSPSPRLASARLPDGRYSRSGL